MQRYRLREVGELLGLSPGAIRSLVRAGFVSPGKGPRAAWLFSFQDLIVLRMARSLAAAKVPAKRITRAVRALRKRLPASMPLSGLRISAVGERVVVKEGAGRWQAEDGQYVLAFEGDPQDGSLSAIERKRASSPHGAQAWFDRALDLEASDAERSAQAYGRAIAADPSFVEAHVNLGLLLHENGKLAQAELAYRDGLEACGEAALLHYNLGVLLEDMARQDEACAAYEAALRADPRLADGHYNLALLCQALGKPKEAIRHMAQYRRLTRRR